MMASSNSPYLKVFACRDHNINMRMGLLSFKSHFLIHDHHSNKLNVLSIATPTARGLPLSSSQPQAQTEVDNHKLLIQESPNGYASLNVPVETQTVGVQFQLQRQCSFGHNFLITGDHPILGSWDPNNAIPLTCSDAHIWTLHLDIPVGQCIRFKLIMQESNGKFLWQPGPDRVFQCFPTQNLITLCEDWENPDSRVIIETEPTINQEIQFVEASATATQEPKEYMNQVLVSDEVVPVLVPGLRSLPVNEGPNHEPEPANGAAMLSDVPTDLTLPELDLKGDIANTSNSNPRAEISPILENQESCENKYQELHVAEEQEHEAARATRSLLHNDIQWSNNVMQKFLNIFGIH